MQIIRDKSLQCIQIHSNLSSIRIYGSFTKKNTIREHQ